MKRTLMLAAALAAVLPALAFAQDAPLAPKGAQFEAKFDQRISSKTAHDGDRFTLTEHEGLFHHAPAALKGAKVEGHVENVVAAGATHKASMNVIFDDVVLANGTTVAAALKPTSMKSFEPKTHHVRDVGLILGGAVVGHMAAGRRHGGLAGAAGGFALANGLKSDVVVKAGTIVHLKLTAPLTTAPANS